MCGRYYIDDDTYEEAEAALVRAGIAVSDQSVRSAAVRGERAAHFGAECRDITPGMTVPVLLGQNAQVSEEVMRWGLSVGKALHPATDTRSKTQMLKSAGEAQQAQKAIGQTQHPHLVINTRSETAAERPLTADSFRSRRCLMPARGFYEWDRDRNRYRFTLPDRHVLLLAGIYDLNEGEKRFSILTKNANEDMERVHSRMPVIIPVECADEWLFGENSADDLVQRDCHIVGRGEFVQQSLDDYFRQ